MRQGKFSLLTQKQIGFIIAKYKELKSYEGVAREFCKKYGGTDNPIKKISDHSVIHVLEEEGIELPRKEKNGFPLLLLKDTTDEMRGFVLDKYNRLGNGISGFNEINELLKSDKGFYMNYQTFENILREGGVNLNSDEYRYGKNGRP